MRDSKFSFAVLAMQMAERFAAKAFRDDPEKQWDAMSMAFEDGLTAPPHVRPHAVARWAIKRVRKGRQFASSKSIGVPPVKERRTAVAKRSGLDVVYTAYSMDDPAEIVAFRLDFTAWYGTLTAREQLMVDEFVSGTTTADLAAMLKMSASAVSQWRKKLVGDYLIFTS